MSGFRLSAGGDRIDRARPVSFRFDGRALTGFAGDTLASALIANGIGIVARSFKYHRPRGIHTAGPEEPNALVQLGRGARTEPNRRATEIELHDGLEARGVNAWPSVSRDLGAAVGRLGPLLAAGFYYKTFMGPRGWWRRVYEPAIRRMAGMGRAPGLPDPDRYDHMHIHADVLVVGSGPAGLAAARAAAAGGARVILAADGPELGGRSRDPSAVVDDRPIVEWVRAVADDLAAGDEVSILRRTTVFGLYDHGFAMAVERRLDHLPPGSAPGQARQRLWHIRARRIVLATGAHERPLLFEGNDRPGVMLAGSVRTYLQRYGVAPGTGVVVATTGDSAYRDALALSDAGLRVHAVIDQRPDAASGSPAAAMLEARGVEIVAGAAVVAAVGGRAVRAVDVRPIAGGGARRIDANLLAVSGGWSPVVHLHAQARGRLVFDEAQLCFRPAGEASASSVVSVGAANGTFDLAAALEEGHRAGAAAARAVDRAADLPPPRAPAVPLARAPAASWTVPAMPPRAKAFVDLQNDVTTADLALAVREGFEAVEHLKRYTTAGMGTDQGKTGNVNAIGIVADLRRLPQGNAGTTTFRPPFTPVAYGALAGRHVGASFDPVRVTPIHPWHVAHGAVMENVGQWHRPRYFPRPGDDMDRAVLHECRTVRAAVGLMDASTLGKIEVAGPDAAAFLDRMYVNRIASLGVGKCRYSVMCRDDGMVFDDGVAMRLAADRFLVTTTTGGAARVLDWFEEWLQTEWPELRVWCTSVTEQWATIAIVGPVARTLLAAVAPGIDLSAGAFRFMTFRDGAVAGLPARIARVSFSGELAFEVSVEGWHGLALWQALVDAGTTHGVVPYGTETMHVLRAEKGYFIVGHETDGSVSPIDLGLERMVARDKDFIGRRSLSRADTARPDRLQLVALLPDDPALVLPEGTQLVDVGASRPPVPMIGHVTSSYRCAFLD
ncbi:MAG: sarcosine oxidase subunit alpha family protein, partial [Alphaproteobacteria bacterium]